MEAELQLNMPELPNYCPIKDLCHPLTDKDKLKEISDMDALVYIRRCRAFAMIDKGTVLSCVARDKPACLMNREYTDGFLNSLLVKIQLKLRSQERQN